MIRSSSKSSCFRTRRKSERTGYQGLRPNRRLMSPQMESSSSWEALTKISRWNSKMLWSRTSRYKPSMVKWQKTSKPFRCQIPESRLKMKTWIVTYTRNKNCSRMWSNSRGTWCEGWRRTMPSSRLKLSSGCTSQTWNMKIYEASVYSVMTMSLSF